MDKIRSLIGGVLNQNTNWTYHFDFQFKKIGIRVGRIQQQFNNKLSFHSTQVGVLKRLNNQDSDYNNDQSLLIADDTPIVNCRK